MTQQCPPDSVPSPVVIFDGDCPFCHFWVRWLIRVDKNRYFYFATANSGFADQISSCFVRDGVNPEKEVVLYHHGRCYGGHIAIFQVLDILGGGWRWLRLFRVIPDFILRRLYSLWAVRRYRWPFKKTDSCAIPFPVDSDRFLHEGFHHIDHLGQ